MIGVLLRIAVSFLNRINERTKRTYQMKQKGSRVGFMSTFMKLDWWLDDNFSY